jgi:hypothetical protein
VFVVDAVVVVVVGVAAVLVVVSATVEVAPALVVVAPPSAPQAVKNRDIAAASVRRPRVRVPCLMATSSMGPEVSIREEGHNPEGPGQDR